MRTRTFFTALFCAGLIIPACGDDTSTSVGSTAVSSASTTASTGGAGGQASASGGQGGQGGQGGTSMGNLDGPCEAQTVATPIDVKAGKTNDGSGFIYADVANAKGLALFFHGGGGSKEDNLRKRIESILIAREAMARGFTVAALDSVKHLDPNATNYQWSEDETANNPDVANTKEMVAQLQDPNGLNAVDANKPVVVFGFSNGGSMASRVAQHLNIASAAIYISNAAGFYVEEAIIPPLVLLPGQNDPGKALSTNTSLADTIEKDGGTVLLHINPPQSLTPGLFMRIPSVDCTLSKSIGNAFLDGALLDDSLMLKSNPKKDNSWAKLLPAEAKALQVQIGDVLNELYAEHSPSSDANAIVFEFLKTHALK